MIFPFILLRYILYLSYPIFKIKQTKESAYVLICTPFTGQPVKGIHIISVDALYNTCIKFYKILFYLPLLHSMTFLTH